MKSNKIQEGLLQLNELIDKNAKVLTEIQNIFASTAEEIFKSSCLKIDHLKRCEPEYCSFRITEECKYPVALEPLIEIKNKLDLSRFI